ncbi:MAG: DNA polymerase III subunit alpha [Bacilli bacterium]|nr:DNA polymerase III subunit alpha [Bacilli bacterium]
MYIPFNVKTNYYLLSSLNDINHLIKKAIALNIKALAVTDSMMYSTMDFYNQCQKNQIKPIIGLEIEFNSRNILLYAMNYEGYQNLTRLVYLKQEQVLNASILSQHSDNLICILPYSSMTLYDEMVSIFPHLYLGYNSLKERSILKEKSPKTIFINEVLYLNKEDNKDLKYLYLIRDGKKMSDIDEYQIEDNHHLMSLREVLEYSDEEDIKWMDEISSMCNITFKSNPHLLPKYSNDKNFNAKVYLQSLCKVGLEKRLNNRVPHYYVDRLKYELNVINKMGFNDYFLVVYDFIKYAKSNNILVGPGRGSAAGSLVSYCLGITNVDPLKYNLLFERFLNPQRVSMPDIDIDFESIRRGEVVDYVMAKYGHKRVAPIITFVTLGGKQAIRDIARIFDYSSTNIDRLCKLIDFRKNLADNYKFNNTIKRLLNIDDTLNNIYKIATSIEGAKRQISVHAAGIVISELELDSYLPLQKYDNYYITGFSMDYLEELGLLKIDFLGLRNLTLIEGILKDVKLLENKQLSLQDIPLNDKQTLELFSKGITEGVFQFESPGMKNFLRKLKPDSFEEIVAAIALFRPGPMANIDSYIRRKFGKEKIDYLHKDLYEILKPTYGIIIYQEQIMQIANVMAGYTMGEADILRRAMTKKQKTVLEAEETKFIKRCIAKNYDKDVATKIYHLILKFADYGFNRAHSVAYSFIGYKMAYLKVHYAKYFMSNLLTNVIGNEAKTKEYIEECRIAGIKLLKPDINLSDYHYKVEADGIRCPLSIIRNVGGVTCKEIVKQRKTGLYKDFFDFVGRTYGQAVNTKTIESLIDADCFNTFSYNHQTLLYNIENAVTYAELVANVDSSLVEKPVIGVVDEMNKKELSNRELAVFGFYLTNHPVLEYKALNENIIKLDDIENYFDKVIEVIIYVEKIKEIKTKNNDEMAFITGSDELSTIDLVMFPNVYKNSPTISKGSVLKVRGRVEKRMSKYQLSAIKVEILSDL